MLSEPQAGRGSSMTRCSRCWPGQRCSRCASFTARPPRRNMAGSGGGAASDTYCMSRCTGYSPCGHHRGVLLEGGNTQGGSVHDQVQPLLWPVQHCAYSASLTAKSPCGNVAGLGGGAASDTYCIIQCTGCSPCARFTASVLDTTGGSLRRPSAAARLFPSAVCWPHTCHARSLADMKVEVVHTRCCTYAAHEGCAMSHSVYEACLPVTCRCWQQRSASGQHALDRHRINTPEAPARVLRTRACDGWGRHKVCHEAHRTRSCVVTQTLGSSLSGHSLCHMHR